MELPKQCALGTRGSCIYRNTSKTALGYHRYERNSPRAQHSKPSTQLASLPRLRGVQLHTFTTFIFQPTHTSSCSGLPLLRRTTHNSAHCAGLLAIQSHCMLLILNFFLLVFSFPVSFLYCIVQGALSSIHWLKAFPV